MPQLREDGEGGGGDGLAVAFHLFVGGGHGELFGELGELGFEEIGGFLEDEIATGARGDPAEDEEVLDVVELGVVGDGVAEAGADGVVDFPGTVVAGLHGVLDFDELFGEGHAAEVEAGGFGEAGDALLGEVLDAAAAVFGPFVEGGVFAVVDGGKGEFVEPRGDVAVGIAVADGLGGAHGDAEKGVGIHAHGAGEGGDFAVVDDVKGDVVPFLAEIAEDGADFFVVDGGVGDAAKEGGDADFVLDVDAGCGTTDGIDAREVGGGAGEGVADAVEVVLRIGLEVGVPGDFFGEDDFAIDDGGGFAIGAAEVEADAAAVEVTTEGGGGAVGWREFVYFAGDDLDGLAEHAGADGFAVEGLGTVGGVEGGEHGGEVVVAGDVDAAAAAGPEQEFEGAFDGGLVEGDVGTFVGEDAKLVMEGGAAGSGEGKVEVAGAGVGFDLLAVVAVPEDGGKEGGVEEGGLGEEIRHFLGEDTERGRNCQ